MLEKKNNPVWKETEEIRKIRLENQKNLSEKVKDSKKRYKRETFRKDVTFEKDYYN